MSTMDKIPLWAHVLDSLGFIMVAMGLYGRFGDGELMFSEYFDLRENAIRLIVGGFALTLPMLLILIRRAKNNRIQRSDRLG